MKKCVILVIFIMVFCFSAQANIIGFGISTESGNVLYEYNGEDTWLNIIGIGINSMILNGEPVGFFMNMNMLLLPLYGLKGGQVIDLSQYNSIFIQDTVVGLGFFLANNENIKFIFGLGLNSYITLALEEYYRNDNLPVTDMMLGLGGVAAVHFHIMESLFVMVTLNTSFPFIGNLLYATGDYKNKNFGINAGISAGFSFFYDLAFY